MKCWHCNNDLIWNNDFSYEEYGVDTVEQDGIVTVLSCCNEDCGAVYECYKEI